LVGFSNYRVCHEFAFPVRNAVRPHR
jgi:hypothetical protein